MKESDFQTLFGKYIKSRSFNSSAVFELKICKGTSLPFNSVQEHQVLALQKVVNEGLYHKLTDQPWLVDRPYPFTFKKPFDCFYLKGIEAFIVVWFYHIRKPKKFIFIPIKSWINEMNTSTRKSLTEARAIEIGTEVAI